MMKIKTMMLLFGIVLFNIKVRMIIIRLALDIGMGLVGGGEGINNIIMMCMSIILNNIVHAMPMLVKNKESSRIIHTKACLRN